MQKFTMDTLKTKSDLSPTLQPGLIRNDGQVAIQPTRPAVDVRRWRENEKSLCSSLMLSEGQSLPAIIKEVESLLTPIDGARLVILTRVFLKHFYEKHASPEIEKAILSDWIKDLSPFSEVEIRDAFDAYRQSTHKNPSPASVRDLALYSTKILRDRLGQAKKRLSDTPPVVKTDEQKAIARDLVKNLFKGAS